MKKHEETKAESSGRPRPYRVRLPGFIAPENDRGLGDVIAGMTYAAGIRPCGGCQERAARLNTWLVFTN